MLRLTSAVCMGQRLQGRTCFIAPVFHPSQVALVLGGCLLCLFSKAETLPRAWGSVRGMRGSLLSCSLHPT